MPLIPYPNVPTALGIPPMPRQAARVTALALAATASYRYGSQFNGPQWQILTESGAAALIPDSVIAFDFHGESRVSNYPVENGAFSSYNKVASPFDARLVISCGGQGQMSREGFLAALGSMADSTDLFTIVTPNAVFPNCNLVTFDFSQKAKEGAKLIVASCYFVEIRQTALASYQATKKPSGANPVSNGAVSATTPTTAQASQLSASGVK